MKSLGLPGQGIKKADLKEEGKLVRNLGSFNVKRRPGEKGKLKTKLQKEEATVRVKERWASGNRRCKSLREKE